MESDVRDTDDLTPNDIVTVPVAARLLLGPRTTSASAYKLAASGRLPGVFRVGRALRVDRRKVIAFIESGGEPLPGGWRREPKA